MDEFKIKFNKFTLYLESRNQVLIFLLSLMALGLVFCHILKLNIFLGISEILFLELLFQIAITISTIYIVTILPTYPIFFIISKNNGFPF